MRVIHDTVTYPRFGLNRSQYKDITYDAYFLDNDIVLNGIQNIKKNPKFYSQAGIDKIGLCLPLDYLDENVPCFYSNGRFSTRKHGGYLHIDIHGEYLNPVVNLQMQLESILDILLIKGFFKIPLLKSIAEFNPDTGEVLSTSEKQYSEIPENYLQFKQIILSKLSLSNLEFKFDLELRLQQFLKQSDFNTCSDTLYSQDYRYYEGGRRKKSLVCIYDKTKQLQEVKKYTISTSVNRFEIRLFSTDLNNHGGMNLLNNSIPELYSNIEHLMIKKLKKLNVDFSLLTEALLTDSPLHKLLSKVVEIETKTETRTKDEKPIDDMDIEFCPISYLHNKTAIQQTLTFFYLIKTLCQGSLNLLCVVARGP